MGTGRGSAHCCEEMRSHLSQQCAIHRDPFECPDQVCHSEATNRYGLIIHDGGHSYLTIRFCPCCGQRLSADAADSP